MNTADLLPAFKALVNLIQRKVDECKTQRIVDPRATVYQRWHVEDFKEEETGIAVKRSRLERYAKEDWGRGILVVVKQVEKTPEYGTFKEEFSKCVKARDELIRKIPDVVQCIISAYLADKQIDLSELLVYLISHLDGKPVPAWCDVDLYGVRSKAKTISFNIGERRFTFRQLMISDFEEEQIEIPFQFSNERGVCILRIEASVTTPWEFQKEALKAVTMLRLFQVCSAEQGREVVGSNSIFSPLVGVMFGGKVRRGKHEMILSPEASFKLQRFWECMAPKLPTELYDFSNKQVNPLSIAFEHYCESLFTTKPIERKIAYAIMGLEAIYLRDVQELMYRLQLGVCKAMSKLGYDSKDVRMHVKEGYKIRNKYVHGDHLSSKEMSNFERKKTSLEALALALLDYLRVSILHFIISGQEKNNFLDLLEESLIERNKDESLERLFEGEKSLLRIAL